jgi:hypothetical protein
MSDLRSPFENPPVPTPDASGAGITARGGDPNINTGGSSGLQGTPWDNPPVSTPGGSETSNSCQRHPLSAALAAG